MRPDLSGIFLPGDDRGAVCVSLIGHAWCKHRVTNDVYGGAGCAGYPRKRDWLDLVCIADSILPYN
jgi:hypothetical protein